MKKYCKKESRNKWSDGFSDTKGAAKNKKNKPSKNDEVVFDDGTLLLIDDVAKCKKLTGKVKLFAVKGGSLAVNDKKLV